MQVYIHEFARAYPVGAKPHLDYGHSALPPDPAHMPPDPGHGHAGERFYGPQIYT